MAVLIRRLSAASVSSAPPLCRRTRGVILSNLIGFPRPLSSPTVRSEAEKKAKAKKKALAKLAKLHVPVMTSQVLDLWLPKVTARHAPAGDSGDSTIHLVDGTVGTGGHTVAALDAVRAVGERVRVLGIDRDAYALRKARKHTRAYEEDLAAAVAARAEGEGIDVEASSESEGGEKDTPPPSLVKPWWEIDAEASSEGGEKGEKPWWDLALHHASYADVSPDLLTQHSFPQQVQGILIDCGVNSHQIDKHQRGFSYKNNGSLDMRFDTCTMEMEPKMSTKAMDLLNNLSGAELAAMFHTLADEPHAEEIAAAIVKWRAVLASRPGRKEVGLRTALELRFVVEEALDALAARKTEESKARRKYRNNFMCLPDKRLKKPKPKKLILIPKKYAESKTRHASHIARVFQALRIKVNDELGHLSAVFEREIAARCLVPGGRLVMLSFQPGEDVIIQEGMAGMVATGKFRPATPEEDGLRPTPDEVQANGRARTARLRAVERVR